LTEYQIAAYLDQSTIGMQSAPTKGTPLRSYSDVEEYVKQRRAGQDKT